MKDLLPFSCKELHTLYAVKEEIGRGGFGVVYAAKRKSDGVEVAIKKVSKDVDTLTEVKDLILGCLTVDPSKRMTLCEVLNHPWGRAGWKHASNSSLSYNQ